MWLVGDFPDIDVGVASPEGGPHDWLFDGHHDDGGGLPLYRVVMKQIASGGMAKSYV